MRILVIGGMHGNETLGIQLVEMLIERPITNVESLMANEEATEKSCRFTGKDLNRSFPGGQDKSYEDVRAKELLALSKNYDLVFDFHNTYCPENDCSFVGESAISLLFDVSSMLGLSRVIVADYDCINKYAPNCISIEISMDSKRNEPEFWYTQIKELSLMSELSPSQTVSKYRFVYRMTLDDKEQFQLDEYELKAFQPLEANLCKKLGVTSPAYPIFIADKFTPYNYGGLLNEID